jgi:hypothetical protein
MADPEPAHESGMTFADFILWLGRTAAVHFGDLPDPNTGEPGEPNLLAAAQIIEIISMLQDRTQGNLSDPESQLVEQLLFELRMRFVQAQQGEKRIIEP